MWLETMAPYTKKKIKNDGSTGDELICRDEIFQGKKGQVFISGNRDAEDMDKLYWNTEKEDRLYSIIPEKLSRVNQIIEEQKIISQGAENAYSGKSGYKPQTIDLNVKNEIQKKADARAEAYRKAKKGDFSDPLYKEMEKRGFIARTGTTGEKVKEIQRYLSVFCSSQKRELDGKYGSITFNNVAYFQIVNKKEHQLDVTGYVDELTYEVLKKLHHEKSRPPLLFVPGILGSTLIGEGCSIKQPYPVLSKEMPAPQNKLQVVDAEMLFTKFTNSLEKAGYQVIPVPYDWRLPVEEAWRKYLKPKLEFESQKLLFYPQKSAKP